MCVEYDPQLVHEELGVREVVATVVGWHCAVTRRRRRGCVWKRYENVVRNIWFKEDQKPLLWQNFFWMAMATVI